MAGCRRERSLFQWSGTGNIPAISGSSADAQCLRFRRSAASHAHDIEAGSRFAGAISAAFQIYSGRRVSGHKFKPISMAAVAGANAQEYLLRGRRSEEHTSELQSLMRISYAVFCLQKKTTTQPSYNYDKTKQH